MQNGKLSPWGFHEIEKWRREQSFQRSYQELVLPKVEKLRAAFDITRYGSLTYDPDRYPLYFVQTRGFSANKETILITGGVHGYETSGVHGALAFLEREAMNFADRYNLICFPCISPWAFETVNRWNPLAIDPNRSFHPESLAEECRLFLGAVKKWEGKIFAHFDLHETTDTDNSVFRPALAQRDGKAQSDFSEIPDGFYLVGDSSRPAPPFQKAIVDSVRKVTHIAPADAEGKLIGVLQEQEGVIHYDQKKLHLCGGFSDAAFVTTTEVYPDSPRTTEAICVDAQVAAVRGGLEFLRLSPALV